MANTKILTSRGAGRRTKVAVVYEDVTTGFRCADWFAQHGYQATMTPAATSADHQLERNLRELHPDVIVVGVSSSPTPLDSTVPRLKSTCPQVPIIAMAPGLTKSLDPDVFLCRSLDPPPLISERVSPFVG